MPNAPLESAAAETVKAGTTAGTVKVWDLPTRVFHWSLVFFVLLSWVTGDDDAEGTAFTLHTFSGYAVFLLVIFRVFWGFFGNQFARFSSFVRGGPAVARHMGSVLRLKPEKHLGHNPAGGWMVVALLGVLLVTTVTGLFAAAEEAGAFLYGIVPVFVAKGAAAVHHILGENLILLLVAIHLLGVIVESLLERQNLARAMVTGRKRADDPAAVDAKGGSLIVALASGVILLAIGIWMALQTSF
jgi:cytochrome b